MSAIDFNIVREVRAVQVEEVRPVNSTAENLERGEFSLEQNDIRWSFTWPQQQDVGLYYGVAGMVMGLICNSRPVLSTLDSCVKMMFIAGGAVTLFDALCAGTNIIVDGKPDWKGIAKVSTIATGTLALSYVCWNSKILKL